MCQRCNSLTVVRTILVPATLASELNRVGWNHVHCSSVHSAPTSWKQDQGDPHRPPNSRGFERWPSRTRITREQSGQREGGRNTILTAYTYSSDSAAGSWPIKHGPWRSTADNREPSSQTPPHLASLIDHNSARAAYLYYHTRVRLSTPPSIPI